MSKCFKNAWPSSAGLGGRHAAHQLAQARNDQLARAQRVGFEVGLSLLLDVIKHNIQDPGQSQLHSGYAD